MEQLGFEGMPRRQMRFVERSNHLDRTEAPHIAVKIAAVWHRIDVRAKEKHRQFLRTRAPAKNIPGMANFFYFRNRYEIHTSQ